ncbi:response regulator [Paenibacillus chartarius]|uniref:Response regulator n=1 Tax=Paenibacillus chartarius TaxID=747481 RepID=A0ABV6DH94_9BACL
MIKLMLVDDEANILRNLQTVLPWKELGVEWLGTARNGRDALELALAETPDIVISDIRMPVMDGIAFLQKLRERGSEAEIILLTGYPDFEYARSAIQLKVKEYVVKPIDYDELQAVVEQTVRTIRERRRQRYRSEQQWGRVKRIAYEKLLHDVLTDMAHVAAGELQIVGQEPVEGRMYALLLADLDDYMQRSLHWSGSERKLWNSAVKNVLQEALLPVGLTYCVPQVREGEWCVLVELRSQRPVAADEIRGWAEALQAAVRDNVRLDLCFCYETKPIGFAQLPAAYRSARQRLMLNERSPAVMQNGEQAEGAGPDPLDRSFWESVESLVSAVKEGDANKARSRLCRYEEEMQRLMKRSGTLAEQLLHFTALHMLRELRDVCAITAEGEEAVWRKLKVSRGGKDVLAVVKELARDAVRAAEAKTNAELWMIKAKDYIERRLADDFGIDDLAEYLQISPSYFSLKFKQAVGSTFLEYVTRLRMERARKLLSRGDKSVAQVGRLVGYEERRYFTKVFHKYFGVSPNEFKESLTKGGNAQRE